MSRMRDGLLCTVLFAALLLAESANAQSYYDGSSVYIEPLPAPDVQTRYDDVIPNDVAGSVAHYPPSGRYIPSYDGDEEVDGSPGLPGREPPPVDNYSLKSQRLPPRAVDAPVRAPVPGTVMSLPPEDQPEVGAPSELPANLKRQLVDYQTKEPAGTIVIDTPNTYLYLVLGHGKAVRYGIGVGREGFTWSGTERISRMKQWPDWFPPTEMIQRQPYLPRVMAGGPGNPLGARALYLGNTLYRIHGTNQPSTIGQTVSSGCIRLLNEDIEDLYGRVQVGSRVVVLPGRPQEHIVSSHPVYTISRVR
jgi:lipoprotein-anchoring transpeptidase ErfK/SrfK